MKYWQTLIKTKAWQVISEWNRFQSDIVDGNRIISWNFKVLLSFAFFRFYNGFLLIGFEVFLWFPLIGLLFSAYQVNLMAFLQAWLFRKIKMIKYFPGVFWKTLIDINVIVSVYQREKMQYSLQSFLTNKFNIRFCSRWLNSFLAMHHRNLSLGNT